MPIGFVLSGGASLGAIQVGMLHALYERGIAPDLIVATSVGAVNGAFIASRPPTVSTAEALGEIWRKIHRDKVFPPNLVTGLLGFLGLRSSLLPNTGLRHLLERHIDFERLELGSFDRHVFTPAGVDEAGAAAYRDVQRLGGRPSRCVDPTWTARPLAAEQAYAFVVEDPGAPFDRLIQRV